MARITHSSRLKTGQELASLLDSFAHRLAVGVERELFRLEGGRDEEAPLERLIRGARERLLGAWRRLVERDEAVQRRTEEGREARRLRDEAAGEVRGLLVRLRNLVVGAWGRREVPRVLGLGRRTSEDPVVLLEQAWRVRSRLLERGRAPAQSLAGQLIPVEIDFPFLAARLGAAADLLKARLAEVASTRQEEEAAIVARREAARDFDGVYRSTRAWLRSLWSLAGMPQLAPLTNVDRRRRRSRPSEPAAEIVPEKAPALSRPEPRAIVAMPPSLAAEARSPAPPTALPFPRSWPRTLALPP
jgi:hypothetical protein